jgi:hypothetical protein
MLWINKIISHRTYGHHFLFLYSNIYRPKESVRTMTFYKDWSQMVKGGQGQ